MSYSVHVSVGGTYTAYAEDLTILFSTNDLVSWLAWEAENPPSSEETPE